MFSTLDSSAEARRRCGRAFTWGVGVQILMLGSVVFLSLLFPGELPLSNKHYVVAWLPDLNPQPEIAPKPPRPRASLPKLSPRAEPAPVRPATVQLLLPPPRPIPTRPPEPAKVSELPPPQIVQPKVTPKVQAPVRTGVFLAVAEPATTSRPAEKVQTGGFGSPEGLPSVAQGGNPGNVPKLGSFGLPEGPGVGNGTGGLGGLPGVVASAGFERAGVGPGAASGTEVPRVRIGGFEKAQLAGPAAARIQALPPPDIDPIEILFKPLPIYTDEARRLQIQGEVVLSVVFQASGSVRIIHVLEFLGHGLDQAAEQAALQIRFKPARRGGQPIDFPATVRIQFRLADQST